MTTIFVSHAKEDGVCAEAINKELEAKGYTVWREPTSLTLASVLSPRTLEDDILGSAALILVWSSHAAHSEWVERHILFAQRLKKLLLPVSIDGTPLPNTLVAVAPVAAQASCAGVVVQLAPSLPAPGSQDDLITLYEQAAHDFIRLRKEASDLAAGMLTRDEHREEVLAVLEYLARHDQMMGVRDKAQEVLDADTKQHAGQPQLPLLRPADAQYTFGVRCSKGHMSYFNKKHVCSEKLSPVHRRLQRAGAELDEIELTCKVCGETMIVRIDCEGCS